MKILLKPFLTLLMLLGIVFGSQNLLSQSVASKNPLIDPSAKVIVNEPVKDTIKMDIDTTALIIPDTVELGKVLRVIYKTQPGVFLTNEQELITLAKFQWKEIYKLQAQEYKFENYKLRVDINDANKEKDRAKKELEDSQEAQLKMSRSYENTKVMLDNKTKENAINESLKNQFKKESRIYKVTTVILAVATTVFIIK